MITIKNLSYKYENSKEVLNNVNLKINENSLLAIVGPNGAGKTTLLKLCLNFLKIQKGSIQFDKKYNIAYVPQSSSVDWDFPITVEEVVVMGTYKNLGLFKRVGRKEYEKAYEKLKFVGMYQYRNRQINELSGGQKQRMFLARALCQEADIYILDEPLQGIDKKAEETIMDLLQKLNKSNHTIIVIHHDLSTIKKYFNEVVLLNKTVIAYGKVDSVFTEENITNAFGD